MISRLPVVDREFWILPLQVACLVVVGAFVGALVTVSPFFGAAAAALALGFGLLTLEQRLIEVFAVALFLGLLGYMFLGRGFAYAGLSPLFVSEVLLGLAVLVLVYAFSLRHFGFLPVLVALFIGWGALRTIPYVPSYGLDALRDAVVWGYALFALAISMVLTTKTLEKVAGFLARLLPFFLVWVPIAAVVGVLGIVPEWPQSGVAMLDFKQGDMAVHVVGMIAFVVSGMYESQNSNMRLPASMFWMLVIVGFAFIATSRAGLITVLVGTLASFLLWPTRRLLPFVAVMAVVGILVVAINPNLQVAGYSRQLGPEQIVENVKSIVGSGGSGNLQGTRRWREQWWGEIWDYTVHGPYFLTGKGFGINLADDDGFQVLDDESLRSPHNGHVTILARMGVPGLALWIAIQVLFGWSLYQALQRAKRVGSLFWARIDTCILVYWMALLINMSFDVYLEGPQGGIWYWTVLGTGLAAIRIQRGNLGGELGQGLGAEANPPEPIRAYLT
jgi:hypothetical protein